MLVVLIAAGFIVGLSLALFVGRGWVRQVAVAIAGLLLLSAWSIYSLTAECPAGHECTPGLGAFFGLFALFGWLAGVGVAALVWRDGGRVGWRTLVVTGAVLLLVASAVVYVHYGFQIARWGCPTDEELNRNQSVEEVVTAFEDSGLTLEAIPLPVWVPPTEPAYRGARAFRHATPRATVYVLVCRQRCAISRFRFGEARKVGEQRWRLGIDSNNNVPLWVTETDRRAGAQMLEAITPALRRVQPYVEYGSRCYIR